MGFVKRREGMPCTKCGSTNTIAWASTRRKCLDCNRTYLTTEPIRPEQPAIIEACECGYSGRMKRNGKTKNGKHQNVICPKCGRQWFQGARKPPDTTVDGQVIVVTSAVNDSRVHTKFLASLKQYVAARNGQLVVLPIRYKNPTSQNEAKQPASWAPAVFPYLMDGRAKVCKGLQILGDIKIQPTAVEPLSGLDTITGQDCGIFGHTKVALKSIATRGHELPKLLLTTGAVTLPAYSDTKAGKKGEFHHVCGAVVIERDGELFHLRHIHASADGTFIDLDTKWTPAGSEQAPPALALVMGDVHAERADPAVIAATKDMMGVLRPKKLVLHDVLDFGSASHHNGFWERFSRRMRGADKVAEELRLTADLIDSLYREGQQTVIISSNHHDHLGRWLADHRNGDDVQNAGIYHRAKAAVLSYMEKAGGSIPDIFALILGPMLRHPARFVGVRDSLTVAGIELAYHGDKGPNGSRGSAKAFDRIGAKTIIGHSHTPAIVGGCFQTGTSSMLDMGYNLGPSSWIHSHVVVYGNGKRSHLHVVGGAWRGAK